MRYNAFRLLESLNGPEYKQALMLAAYDRFEFLRRIAVTRMGRIGDEAFISVLIDVYVRDRNAARIVFNISEAIRCFDKQQVEKAIETYFADKNFYHAREEKQELLDKLIERKDGRKFVTTLQVNVEQRGVEFVPGTGRSPRAAQAQEAKNNPAQGQAQGTENTANTNKEQRRNTWTNADGSIRPISKWSGVDFTEQQKADYVAGKAVKLENVTDKQGFHATMYIRFNPEKGRPYRYDTNPDNAQKVAPSNESRTQVAVNSEGKTNEATKNLKEPLRKGQTAPKDTAQQQQQEKPQKKNNKGMKM